MQLVKYEAACRALAAAKSVDEVKSWIDRSAAIKAYGRMAKDKTLEVDAAEIRIRAERRLGEMLAEQKATIGLNSGSRVAGSEGGSNDGSSAVVVNDHRPTLESQGVSKDLSSRAQKLAAVPAEQFESEVGQWRERVSAENARVTSRLEVAGERAMSDKAPSTPVDKIAELEADISALRELNEILRSEAINASDAAEQAMDVAAKLQAVAAGEEMQVITDLQSRLQNAESQRDVLMNENAALKREVKTLRAKLKRAGVGDDVPMLKTA